MRVKGSTPLVTMPPVTISMRAKATTPCSKMAPNTVIWDVFCTQHPPPSSRKTRLKSRKEKVNSHFFNA